MKNVAGFDLVRLATGAFGTLGAITDVSLRLHALPALDQTFAVRLDDAHLAALHEALGLHALGFMALELLNDPASAACDGMLADVIAADDGAGWTLVARVAGNSARCAAQRALLGVLGRVTEVDGAIWSRVRALDGIGSAVARVSASQSSLHTTVTSVRRCLSEAGVSAARLCVTPHRGSVRVILPPAQGADSSGNVAPTTAVVQSLRALQLRADGRRTLSVIWERLPERAWTHVPPANDNVISQRIQDAFDPHRILNRGIFGAAAPVPHLVPA